MTRGRSQRRVPALRERGLVEAIAADLVPVEPGPARRVALRSRILDRIAGRAPREPESGAPVTHTVVASAGRWLTLVPDVDVKLLHEEGDVKTFLVRMAPGSSVPAHDHIGDEHCMVLEGEVWLGEVFVRAGDFHFAPAGSRHGRIHTDSGCLLFIRSPFEFPVAA